MPRATVQIPSLLVHVVDGRAEITVNGDSLSAALTDLLRQCPGLGVHLFDESGGLREHVLCFHNEQNTRWFESMDVPLAEGDRIRIYQAVSGG